ncbi:GatB/YqeY domain-containing protein [Patescibacteria group bacterium]|nr:GatB/YqeY domain-containing protein [Patescibacteria group bacterium]MBU4115556.1 GatB/YqeY domain-containing protein [Patescibacteria group bacterium]
MLHNQIKEEIKIAIKAREELRLSVLRGMLASFVNELVATKRKPDEILPNEDALTVVKRLVKQRKDSFEQFRAGRREDLASKEEAELKILEKYLPEMMSYEEIEKVILAKKEELGVADKSKMGILMGAVMKELKGKADGGDVKKIIEKLFLF